MGGSRSLGTGVAYDSQLSYMWVMGMNWTWGPLEDQQMSLTAKLLSSPHFLFLAEVQLTIELVKDDAKIKKWWRYELWTK